MNREPIKKFYFMNKPEVMEVDEYENPEQRMTFYSRRSEIHDRREKRVILVEETQKKKKKARRIIYLIDILLIVGILFYWNWNRDKPDGEFFVKNDIKYYFHVNPTNPPQKNKKEIFHYVQNTSSKPILISESYSITYYIKVDGDEINLMIKNIDVNKHLEAKDQTTFHIQTITIPDGMNPEKIGIKMNDEFVLEKDYSN